MESRDIYVQATLYDHIMDARYARKIVPSLELSDYLTFVPSFTKRCMQMQSSNEAIEGQELVGYEFMRWFVSLYEDKSISRETLVRLKRWLADFYRESDAELRVSLVNIILEHLFENKKIRRFFSDWKTDPILSQAYEAAEMWIKGLP